MIRGILGVITGCVIWSALWCFLNWIFPVIFPRQFNVNGTTDNFVLNLIIVLLSFDFSFISGYINAIIAKVHQLRFALIQGILQLAIGIYVQKQYWDIMPLWFHITFLLFIIPGIFIGALYQKTNELKEIP